MSYTNFHKKKFVTEEVNFKITSSNSSCCETNTDEKQPHSKHINESKTSTSLINCSMLENEEFKVDHDKVYINDENTSDLDDQDKENDKDLLDLLDKISSIPNYFNESFIVDNQNILYNKNNKNNEKNKNIANMNTLNSPNSWDNISTPETVYKTPLKINMPSKLSSSSLNCKDSPIVSLNLNLTTSTCTVDPLVNANNTNSTASSVKLIENIVKCLDENEQNKLITSLTSMEFYIFICNSSGKRIILDKLSNLNNDKNNKNSHNTNAKKSKDNLLEATIYSKAIYEKIKEHISFYLFNKDASEVLIKILKYLNFYDRLNIWKTIHTSNLLTLASNPITSAIMINLINSLTDKSEEALITKLLSFNYFGYAITFPINPILVTQQFETNLYYLAVTSNFSTTVLQTILGRFTPTSLASYSIFVLKYIALLVASQIGILTVEKYVTVFRNQPQQQKDIFVSALLQNLPSIVFNVDAVNILVSVIEQWGIDYLEVIIKSSYLNEGIQESKDNSYDMGINLLFHKLINSLKIVSSIK